jgi:hypothetical protein
LGEREVFPAAASESFSGYLIEPIRKPLLLKPFASICYGTWMTILQFSLWMMMSRLWMPLSHLV